MYGKKVVNSTTEYGSSSSKIFGQNYLAPAANNDENPFVSAHVSRDESGTGLGVLKDISENIPRINNENVFTKRKINEIQLKDSKTLKMKDSSIQEENSRYKILKSYVVSKPLI